MADQTPPVPSSATPSGTSPANPADTAKEAAGRAAETLKGEAASFVDSAKDQARDTLSAKKDVASDALSDFANAVRRAGEELSRSDRSAASGLVRQAADGLEGLSRSVSEKQPEEMLHALRDFGRENPTAMIAGSVLAGLALGRFLRASDKPRGESAAAQPPPRLGSGQQGDGHAESNAGGAAATAPGAASYATEKDGPIELMDSAPRFSDTARPEDLSEGAYEPGATGSRSEREEG